MEVTCPRPTAAPEPVFSWPWLPPPPPGLLDRRRPLAFPAADTELAFRAGRPWRLPPPPPSGPHMLLGAAQSHAQIWEELGTTMCGFVCQASRA